MYGFRQLADEIRAKKLLGDPEEADAIPTTDDAPTPDADTRRQWLANDIRGYAQAPEADRAHRRDMLANEIQGTEAAKDQRRQWLANEIQGGDGQLAPDADRAHRRALLAREIQGGDGQLAPDADRAHRRALLAREIQGGGGTSFAQGSGDLMHDLGDEVLAQHNGGQDSEPIPTHDDPAPAKQAALAQANGPIPASAVQRGFGKGLDDDAMKRAQRRAADAAFSANMLRVGDTISQSFGQKQGSADLAKNIEAQGEQGVKNIQERRQASLQEKQLKDEQELDDPSSPGSRFLLSAAKRMGVSDEMLDGKSGKDVLKAFPMLKDAFDREMLAQSKKEKVESDAAQAEAARKAKKEDLEKEIAGRHEDRQTMADAMRGVAQIGANSRVQVAQISAEAKRAAAKASAGEPLGDRENAALWDLFKQDPAALNGFGRNGAVKKAVISWGMSNDPEFESGKGSLATSQAEGKANKSSLVEQQGNADKVSMLSRKASMDLDTFLDSARKIPDAAIPLLNRPWREVQDKFAGNPNMTRFNTALTTVASEIGKIVSGSTGAAGVTDNARKEIESLFPRNGTLKQLYAAADVLRREMKNREDAQSAQLAETKSRLGKRPAAEPAPTAEPALAPEDQVAVDWARSQIKADPSNAKAKKILELHGLH
jgi:hypothetical protein